MSLFLRHDQDSKTIARLIPVIRPTDKSHF